MGQNITLNKHFIGKPGNKTYKYYTGIINLLSYWQLGTDHQT